jgi:PAS domain S-box-containing protein
MDGKDTASALNASLLLDNEDRILEGNRDAEVFLERPLEEVRKAPLQKANPALYSALKELLAKTKRGRGVEDYALAYKVGKRLMRLNINMSPYPLEALGTTGTLVTINSVGMRPTPERRVSKKEAPPPAVEEEKALDLTQFLESLVEPAFLLDLDAVFTYVNPVMCSLLGQEREDIIGRPLSFFMHKDEAKKSIDHLVEAARAAPWRGELEFGRSDGTTSVIAITVDALKPGRGRKEKLLGIGRENTGEARIRREREDELKRVWSLLERVGVALACFTPDFRVTLLSHSAEDLLSTTSDRAIGTPLPDLFPAGTRQAVTSLLERAVRGDEVDESPVQAGSKEEPRSLFMSVRHAVGANGRTREFMAILREGARGLSDMEEADAQLKVARRKERILELAIRTRDHQEFLLECLRGMEVEFGCAAAAVYALQGEEAVLLAQTGLEAEDGPALSVLKLRPGHKRLCGMMVRLEVEIQGGVPRKGWDDVHNFVDKADGLLPLLREKRWRNVLVFPMRIGGEAAGALALADSDPVKVDLVDELAFATMGEAVLQALSAFRVRDDEGAEVESAPPEEDEAAPEEAPSAPIEEDIRDTHVAGESGGSGVIPTLATSREQEHDYFEIAQEVKGKEVPPDNLALFGDGVVEQAVNSAKGIDLPALLWDLKEYYSKGRNKGEVFLEIEEDLPKLHTDKRLLREALMQLLDNAFKFSTPGTPVILGAERWGDEVLIRIEDQGPGIPDEVVQDIMRRNLEEPEGDERARIGVTGLFLCRKYVATMGGDLNLKGRQDEGTTAFIRLRVLPFIGEG